MTPQKIEKFVLRLLDDKQWATEEEAREFENLADLYWEYKMDGEVEMAEKTYDRLARIKPARTATEQEYGTTYSTTMLGLNRYMFDELCAVGWKQWDTYQDAPYLGAWVNPEKRMLLVYAEGDLSLTVCPTFLDFELMLQMVFNEIEAIELLNI